MSEQEHAGRVHQPDTAPITDAVTERNPRNEMLAEVERELEDDPDLTIDKLTPEEQRKIVVVLWGVTHTRQYQDAIVTSMVPTDYCLAETVNGSFYPRLDIDRDVNFESRLAQMQGAAQVDPKVVENLLLECPANAALQHDWPMPILRTIDVEGDDLSPDPRYRTHQKQAAAAEQLGSDINNALLIESSSEIRARIEEYVNVRASSSADRELVQLDQISVIAANAVRRHPDKDQIVIGIVVGATHAQILDALAEGTEIRTEPIKYVPEHVGRFSNTGVQELVRARSFGEMPSDTQVNRELLSMIMYSALENNLFTASTEVATVFAEFFKNEEAFTDQQIEQMLQEIDADKARAREESNSEGERAGLLRVAVADRIRQLADSDARFANLLNECRDISRRPRSAWW